MALKHRTARSNDVRAPAVERGEAIIVGRYRDDNPKVALVNPEDLAMLEESYDLIQAASVVEPLPRSPLALKALAIEDQPDDDALIEDPDTLAKLFG